MVHESPAKSLGSNRRDLQEADARHEILEAYEENIQAF